MKKTDIKKVLQAKIAKRSELSRDSNPQIEALVYHLNGEIAAYTAVLHAMEGNPVLLQIDMEHCQSITKEN